MLRRDIHEFLTDILRIIQVIAKMKNGTLQQIFFKTFFIWFHKYVIALYCSCDQNKLQLLNYKLHFNMTCPSFKMEWLQKLRA